MKELIEKKIKEDKPSQIIFERIFEIWEYEITLERKIKEINPDLEKQKITIIRDKILQKETIFNLARKKRKIPSQSGTIKESYDPFCNGKKNILNDELGSLENDKARIVANIAKMAPFHSILYFKKHDFDDLTFDDFFYALNLSYEWFEKIEKNFSSKTHILIWNFHFPAGASIYHPHFQLLSFYHLPSKIIDLKQKFENYEKEFNSSYLDDYFYLMKKLELGLKKNTFRLWFPLTPIRNNEFNFSGDLKENSFLIWQVIKNLMKIETQSFNFFYLYKSPLISHLGFFVDRGEVNRLTSDFGTLEVFYHPVVSFNPFQIAKEVFSNLEV